MKLNIDGTWDATHLVGVWGRLFMIGYNFFGGFIQVLSSHPLPLFAEAIPVREGLALAYSWGFQNIIVESDSLQSVQALCFSSPDLSPVGLIVEDSRAIASAITRVSFTHIRCQANEVAHRLACYSLSFTAPALWFEEPPDIILDILFVDC